MLLMDRHCTTESSGWRMFVVLATWLCAGLFIGCGSGEDRVTAETAHAVGKAASDKSRMPLGKPDGDGDADNNDDEASIRDYGRPASTTVWRTIARLISGYHRASVMSDSVEMCSSISGSLAEAFAEERAASGGIMTACAKRVQILLRGHFARAGAHARRILIVTVRVKGATGLGLLRLPSGEEREETVIREDGKWKIASLFDMGMI
jgi:hypothetical protein